MLLFFVAGTQGQQAEGTPAAPGTPTALAQASASPVPRVLRISGAVDLRGAPQIGAVDVTFALYRQERGGTPAWSETQKLEIDQQGRYAALLGAAKGEGLPSELFLPGEQLWMGMQVHLPGWEETPRVLLVSAPYALKAGDAETLGGKPLSAFVLAESAGGGAAKGAAAAAGASIDGATSAATDLPGRAYQTSGTTNFIGKFVNSADLGNSAIHETGGNVGIGTTAPGSRLTLYDGSNTAAGQRVALGSGPGTDYTIGRSPATGFLDFSGNQSGFVGYTFSGGNVGIGTANPSSRLTIYDSSNTAAGQRIALGSGPGFDYTIRRNPLTGLLNFSGSQAGFVGYTFSGGNVGIGTEAPAQALDVAGNANVTGNLTMGGTLTLPANGLVAGTNQLVLSGGNVGIGTASPAHKLDVAGNIRSDSQLISTVATGTAPLAVSSTTKVANLNADLLDGMESTQFAPATGSPFYLARSGDAMTGSLSLPANGLVAGGNQLVLSGGNVGMGASPTFGRLVLAPVGASAQVAVSNTGVSTTWMGASSPYGIIAKEGSKPILFKTGSTFPAGITTGTERMRITGAGNVGIGTSSPAGKLEVAGNIQISGPGNGIIFSDGSAQATLGAVPTQLANRRQIALLRWYAANQTGIQIPVGFPQGVLFDGANIWVASIPDVVVKVRPSDGATLATVNLGVDSQPYQLAFDGANIWVGIANPCRVAKIRASDGIVLATFPIGFGYSDCAQGLTFDGQNIFVVVDAPPGHTDGLVKVRPSDGSQTYIGIDLDLTPEAAVSDGSAFVWVTDIGGKLFRINTIAELLDGEFDFPHIGPHGLAFDGNNIWMSNIANHTVKKIRASDGVVLNTVPVGLQPHFLAFDGVNIWVTNSSSNTVTKIRASDAVVLGTFAGGDYPYGVAFDGANIWVTNSFGGTVSKM